jgi:hypothetical protein
MVEDKHITQCMLKRSKFVLRIIFNKPFLKLMVTVVPLIVLCMVPVIFINVFIMGFAMGVFNISRQSGIGGLCVIIILVGSMIEMFIGLACISCIPQVEKFGDKIMDWVNINQMV